MHRKKFEVWRRLSLKVWRRLCVKSVLSKTFIMTNVISLYRSIKKKHADWWSNRILRKINDTDLSGDEKILLFLHHLMENSCKTHTCARTSTRARRHKVLAQEASFRIPEKAKVYVKIVKWKYFTVSCLLINSKIH